MTLYSACKRCGQPYTGKVGQRRCSACRAVFKADPEQKQKALAQRLLAAAIAKGDLIRRPCEYVNPYNGQTCLRQPTHAHHEDYSRPLDVAWLCAGHHHGRHRDLRRRDPPALILDRPGLPQPDRDW